METIVTSRSYKSENILEIKCLRRQCQSRDWRGISLCNISYQRDNEHWSHTRDVGDERVKVWRRFTARIKSPDIWDNEKSILILLDGVRRVWDISDSSARHALISTKTKLAKSSGLFLLQYSGYKRAAVI